MSTYGVPLRRSVPLVLGRHRDAPTPAAWRAWAEAEERPLAVDLFAGAGGLSLGLEAAGYRVALAVDLDPRATETHRHNFAGDALQIDLSSPAARDQLVERLSGLDIALIAGGPPCQPYSRAGRSKIRSLVRDGSRSKTDHRRELWRAFLDVALCVEPAAILMENVPDMALGDDMAILRSIMDRLAAARYDVDARLVDTADHGVPQHRQRLIIAATRDRGVGFSWPEPIDRITLWDAIGDLPPIDVEHGDVGQVTLPYGGSETDFQRRARKGCIGSEAIVVHDHVTRPVRQDDLEAFSHMDARTRYSDLPKHLRRYRDDIFDDKYKRLAWDELSRSITAHIAKDGYWYIHPRDPRTLTVREAARVQTFPDDFRFAGSRSHQFSQIGNAVPPALAEAIGVALLAATRHPIPARIALTSWREEVRAHLDTWAAGDRRVAPHAYPGDPWAVVVGLALRDDHWPDPRFVLRHIPTVAFATSERLRFIQRLAIAPGAQRAVSRIVSVAEAVRDDPARWLGCTWQPLVRPAERAWIDVLALDPSRMHASTATLRVVARLTGTPVDRERRLSDGRMELAKVVGAGDQAAARNAALHRIGVLLCRSDEPQCHECPLTDVCDHAGKLR